MKKTLKISGAVICSIGIGLYLIGITPFLMFYTELTCNEKELSGICKTRMRMIGNALSQKGDLGGASRWYLTAAQSGDEVAMFHLAWIYQEYARNALEQAWDDPDIIKAHDEDVSSVVDLLAIKKDKIRGFEKPALDWYKKAAAAGFAPAMNNLGQMYLYAISLPHDAQTSFQWILKSAEKGNPIAAQNVALAYRMGYGVERNSEKAEKWALWHATNLDKRDIASITLERTVMVGNNIPKTTIKDIQDIAIHGGSLKISIRPMQPDASIPTFNEVQEQLVRAPATSR